MGAKPAFTFLAFDYDIPFHILDSPIICDLETWATDLLILSNVGNIPSFLHTNVSNFVSRTCVHIQKSMQTEMMATTSSPLL